MKETIPMKKLIAVLLAATMITVLAAGCGTNAGADKSGSGNTAGSFDSSNDISVISREDGSGTRGAFVELFGVEEKDANGKKIDLTTDEATITNSTSVVLTSVAGNQYAIGYVSLGSMNDTVKALKIDGTEATADNIKSGT
jgi:phosphate transport system substrate-binding protein